MVAVFLADGFEEIEALAVVDVLRRAELTVVTVGIGGRTVCGAHGIPVGADMDEAAWEKQDMDALQAVVAMPTAFVDQNNTARSSALGRLLAESLFYEFNQRGFPAREYRLNGAISVQGGREDLALAADQMVSTVGQKWAALVVGTYHVDKDATFVNARLVRASDGLVLRTGQLVLVNTAIVARLSQPDAPRVRPVSVAQAAAPRRPASLYTPMQAMSSGVVPIRQGR